MLVIPNVAVLPHYGLCRSRSVWFMLKFVYAAWMLLLCNRDSFFLYCDAHTWPNRVKWIFMLLREKKNQLHHHVH